MRCIISVLAILCVFAVPVQAEEGCGHKWSAGVGFSFARADWHYEPLGELELLFVLSCPIADTWEWYVEGGIGVTSHQVYMVPLGVGALRSMTQNLRLGVSANWYTYLHPRFAGSALIGPLVEWEMTDKLGLVFIPGFVMHVNHAERAYGAGAVLSLEF